jgi:hypothetical protein
MLDISRLTYRWANKSVEHIPQEEHLYENIEEKIKDTILRATYIHSKGIEEALIKEYFRYESAPLKISFRENHGLGYHYHLLIKNGSDYIRTGIVITVQDGKVYAVEHGKSGKTLLDIEKYSQSIIRCIEKSSIPKDKEKIKQFLTASKDAIELRVA